MAPTMLEELCKRIQHCCATLRRSRNKRNVGSCWLKSLTGFKLCATTFNNMQQGVQTDATCNIQQCWSTMLRLFALGLTDLCQPKCYSGVWALHVLATKVTPSKNRSKKYCLHLSFLRPHMTVNSKHPVSSCNFPLF